MTTFVYIVEPWGFERSVQANTRKEAHKAVWESLTDAQRDACSCLDCVDEINNA